MSAGGERKRTEYTLLDATGLHVATHYRADYVDAEGVARKTMWWAQPDGTSGLGGRKVVDLPLYGVERLVDLEPRETVVVTEGERACAALLGVGVVAVGTVTGASTIPAADVLREVLGFDVVLWPDHDDPGREHMQRIAARLCALGIGVRMLAWPGAREEGDDAADFVERGGTREELRALLDAAEEHEPAAAPDGSDEANERQSRAVALIRLGDRAALFVDERGDSYARIQARDVRRVVRVGRGRDFRDWLRQAYYDSQGGKRAATSEDVASAIGVLSAKARYGGPRYELHNRFALDEDGNRWLDLADAKQRAVKITRDGWAVVDQPPILFRRYAHQAPLPTPVRGGDIREVVKYLHVRPDDPARPAAIAGDAALLLGWLGAAMIGDVPRAAVILFGPEGAAKTTAGRILTACVDPSVADTTTLPHGVPELAQVLDHHAAIVIDNVRHLPQAHEDALCRAVTGGAFEKRQLDTDEDDIILTFRRLVVIAAIPVPTTAPDLLDRAILVELERVADKERRREDELWTAFLAARPRILGAILDAVSGAMRIRDTLDLGPLPRMADWTAWAAAACEAAGIGAQVFLDAYRVNREMRTAEIVASQPVAEAVCALVAEVGTWSGTASELLAVLDARRGDRPPPRDWPRRADALARRLRVLATTLRAARVAVEHARDTDGRRQRRIVLRRVEGAEEESSSPYAAPYKKFRGEASEASGGLGNGSDSSRLASDASPDASRGGVRGSVRGPDASDASRTLPPGKRPTKNPRQPYVSDTSDTSDASPRHFLYGRDEEEEDGDLEAALAGYRP